MASYAAAATTRVSDKIRWVRARLRQVLELCLVWSVLVRVRAVEFALACYLAIYRSCVWPNLEMDNPLVRRLHVVYEKQFSLSVCVCLSLTSRCTVEKTFGRIELFLAWRLLSTYPNPVMCYKEIR